MGKLFKKVAYHNYVFHADEVACAAVIRYLYDSPEMSIRISARDDDKLNRAVMDGFTLVDVGGGRFDHHSTDAMKVTYTNGVIKSSLGYVLDQSVHDGKITEYEMEYLLLHGLYALQASDNGQDFRGVASPFEYVKWLNGSDPADDEAQMQQFNVAVEIGVRIIDSMLKSAKRSLPNHAIFLDAASKMKDGIVDLPHYMATAVEEAQSWNDKFQAKKIRFFTFPGSDGKFRIQAVNKIGSFALEYELPFKGLRNESLCKAAEILDGIFVHPNGFIASAGSLDSCRKLGIIANKLC